MNARLLQMTLILAVFVGSSAASPGDPTSQFDLLEAYESTWNMHDGDALAGLFTVDADMIMGSLPRVAGREAIGEWWQTYFSRIDDGRKGEFELLSETLIAPGVRLINVSSKTSGTDASGGALETRLARGTWVVVRRGETWRIAAMRGLPAEGEDRTRPGTD